MTDTFHKNTYPQKLYLGNTPLAKLYDRNVQIWPRTTGLRKDLSDSVYISDIITLPNFLYKYLSDTIAVSESMLKDMTLHLTDIITANDVPDARIGLVKYLTDNVTTSDLIIGTEFSKILSEIVYISDSYLTSGILRLSLTDNVNLSDAITSINSTLRLYDTVSISEYASTNLVPASSLGYGRLYNYPAITDIRNITINGWHIPTLAEFITMSSFLGGDSISGGKTKETGVSHWTTPNTGATNLSEFTMRGSGRRIGSGSFMSLSLLGYLWAKKANVGDSLYVPYTEYNSSIFHISDAPILGSNEGVAIRPVKDSTTLVNGQKGQYIGNDGTIYSTICIGSQEWLIENLKETKYRNGVNIPQVTNNASWGALTTGAWCYYNNDPNNL